MHILIATHNRWKYQLFSPIFLEHGFEVRMLPSLPSNQDKLIEVGTTVIENALLKAHHYHSLEHPWVFADDVGLEIAALGGAPGVQMRRWAGKFQDDVEDRIWLEHLLSQLLGVPPGERTAQFVDGWALLTPDGSAYTREMRTSFEIAERPVRPLLDGSPILCVAEGLPDDPLQILAETRSRWKVWGILDELLGKASV